MALYYEILNDWTPKESNMNNTGRSPVVTQKSIPNPEGVEYKHIQL